MLDTIKFKFDDTDISDAAKAIASLAQTIRDECEANHLNLLRWPNYAMPDETVMDYSVDLATAIVRRSLRI